MAAGGHKVQVAADAGLSGMQKTQIVIAVDDPEVLVTGSEIQNLLVGRQDDEGREPDFGANWNDLSLRVLYGPCEIRRVGEGTRKKD